jgi:hypothetical protein
MRTISLVNTLKPVGTLTGPPASGKRSRLSQYRRADDAPVAENQYQLRLSSRSSRLRMFSGCPSQSTHAQIHRASNTAPVAGTPER